MIGGVMGFFSSSIKLLYKGFFDFKRWMNWDKLKQDSKSLYIMSKSVLNVDEDGVNETFDEAIERFKLTEAHIKQAQKHYYNYTVMYVVTALLCVLYTFFLFFDNHFMAGIIAFLLAIFVFVKALQTHFLYFQIKNRKLGCSVKEWFNNKVNM